MRKYTSLFILAMLFLVAFLKTLSDPDFLNNPAFSRPQ